MEMESKETQVLEEGQSCLTNSEIFRLRSSIVEIVEDLKLRQTVEKENEERISQLLSEKHQLERSLESEKQSLQRLEEKHQQELVHVKQQCEERLKSLEEEQKQFQIMKSCAEKDMATMKEEARVLQLSKYKAEKRVKELESRVSSQDQRSETHLAQVASLEGKMAAIKSHYSRLEGSQSRLDKNVEEAVKKNETLIGVNRHQQCIIDALRQDVMTLREQLVESRAACQRQAGDVLQEAQQLKHEIQRLQAQVTALDMEKNSSRRELESCHENWQKALSNLKTSQALVRQYQADGQSHQRQVEDLLDQLQTLKQQVEDLNIAQEEACQEVRRLTELRQQNEEALDAKVRESEEQSKQVQEQLQDTCQRLTTTQDLCGQLSDRVEELTQQLTEAQAKLNVERTSVAVQTDVSLFLTSSVAAQTDRCDVSVATQVAPEMRETSSETERVIHQSDSCQTEAPPTRAVPCQTYIPSVISQATQTSLDRVQVSDAWVQMEATGNYDQSVASGQPVQVLPVSSEVSPGAVARAEDSRVAQQTAITVQETKTEDPGINASKESPSTGTAETSNVMNTSEPAMGTAADSYDISSAPVVSKGSAKDPNASTHDNAHLSDVINVLESSTPAGLSQRYSATDVTNLPTFNNTVSMLKSIQSFKRIFSGKAASLPQSTPSLLPAKALVQGRATQSEGSVLSSTSSYQPLNSRLSTDAVNSPGQSLSAFPVLTDPQQNVLSTTHASTSYSSSGNSQHADAASAQKNTSSHGAEETSYAELCQNKEINENNVQNAFGLPRDHLQEGGDMYPELSSADIMFSPIESASGSGGPLPVKDQYPTSKTTTPSSIAISESLSFILELQPPAVECGVEIQDHRDTKTQKNSSVTATNNEQSDVDIKSASDGTNPTLSSSETAALRSSTGADEATYGESSLLTSRLALTSPKGSCLSLSSKQQQMPRRDVRIPATSSKRGVKMTSVSVQNTVKQSASQFPVTPKRCALPFTTYGNASPIAVPGPSLERKTYGLPGKQPDKRCRTQSRSPRSQPKYPRLEFDTQSNDPEPKVTLPLARKGILKGNQAIEGNKGKFVTFAPLETQMTDSEGSDDEVLFSDVNDDEETMSGHITPSQCQRIVGLLEEHSGTPVTSSDPAKRELQD